jgi:hypothetical protein
MRLSFTRFVQYCVLLPLLSGCIAHKQYRSDYTPCEIAPNASTASCEKHALQRTTNGDGSNYLLGFIEFDDQGQLWDRQQMSAVLNRIATEPRELLMVVFVHGWKHSAAPGDDNIETFRQAMAKLSAADAQVAARNGTQPRQVVGVYLGWRGGSVSVPGAKELTFWERKNTAQKVGHGSVTEVLSRLELIKETKNSLIGNQDTRLVVVGHSFGGAVVFAAVGQLLANRFVHTKGPVGQQSTVSGYGDLVVLINPAFEATLFSSLSDMSTERGTYFDAQLPVVAVLTSQADDATKRAFPLGRQLSTLFEKEHAMVRRNAVTKRDETIDGKDANVTAIGHFEPYRTHTLSATTQAPQPQADAAAEAEQTAETALSVSEQWANDRPGSVIGFSSVALERTQTSAGRNPYIVAYVDKTLIPNHNKIDDPRVIAFIEQLIFVSTQPRAQLQRTLESKRPSTSP